jgi:hypothetical protein
MRIDDSKPDSMKKAFLLHNFFSVCLAFSLFLSVSVLQCVRLVYFIMKLASLYAGSCVDIQVYELFLCVN